MDDREKLFEEVIHHFQERISESNLLNQVSLATEIKEWMMNKDGSEVLFVSEVLNEANQSD